MISKLLKQIQRKRQRAKRAGLEIISADELAMLALKSPHWREIGRGKAKYNFCRRDHSIGYTAENTFIGSFLENIRERNERCGNLKIHATPNDRKRASERRHSDYLERNRQRAKQNYHKDPEKQRTRAAKNYAKRKAAAAGKAATASNSTSAEG
jgi:hypothetical protein